MAPPFDPGFLAKSVSKISCSLEIAFLLNIPTRITYGMRRGLLLPQVPVEHGWDRLAFLAQTCLKAGAPPDAWQHGAVIEAFTAEVFGE